ncbi:hypothetical protein ACTMU2_26745 [Cupriavidus basilensis]
MTWRTACCRWMRSMAHEMLSSLRGFRLMTGFRGKPPADIEAAASAIAALSDAAMALGDQLCEKWKRTRCWYARPDKARWHATALVLHERAIAPRRPPCRLRKLKSSTTDAVPASRCWRSASRRAAHAALASRHARAAAFPARPVTLVVPFAAGGAAGTLVRTLADGASKHLQTRPARRCRELVQAPPVCWAPTSWHAPNPDGYIANEEIMPEPVFRLPHLQKTQFDPMQ